MPMMSGPPERTLLCRCASQESEAELENPTGLVASVGEITMEPSGDTELPDKKHKCAKHDGFQVYSGPKSP